MSSQIITPPDHLNKNPHFLILEPTSTDLNSLVVWLQSIEEEEYLIHIYTDKMNDLDWLAKVAYSCNAILIPSANEFKTSKEYKLLEYKHDSIVTYGSNPADFPDLLTYFLSNR